GLVLGPDPALAPALWRILLDRSRTADSLVLAAAPPGRADLTLRAVGQGWGGLGRGSGRLRRPRLEITAEGRGIAGQRTAEVLLPRVDGMIAAVPARADGTARPAAVGERLQLLPSAQRAG